MISRLSLTKFLRPVLGKLIEPDEAELIYRKSAG